MGNADQDINAALGGVQEDANGNPTQTPLNWRWVRVRGRQTPNGLVIGPGQQPLLPFGWPNPAYPASVSAFDALQGTAEQVASRHIDPYGNVVNLFTVWVVQWYWMLDGCPSPLSQKRLSQYLSLANKLNPWPNNYPAMNRGQFPNENYADYPAWPPSSPTPLDHFLPASEKESEDDK